MSEQLQKQKEEVSGLILANLVGTMYYQSNTLQLASIAFALQEQDLTVFQILLQQLNFLTLSE